MRRILLSLILGMVVCTPSAFAKNPDEEFRKFCQDRYVKEGACPEALCQLDCLGGKKEDNCAKVCSPRPCPSIAEENCPAKYCAVMTNCSNEKICHYQMYGEKAKCGDLAYAGQDVVCCPGMIQRCGVEFFDGNCDMEGQNSVYALPICIPCGNGVCGNFENRCNCPEDCHNPTLDNPIKKKETFKAGKSPRKSKK